MQLFSTILAFVLFAQEKKEGGDGGLFNSFMLPMLLIFLAFMYFMVFLPERQRKKQQQSLLNALKKNDKIITIGGIIGVVSYIDEKSDEITIRLDEGKMKILKSSIMKVMTGDDQAKATEAIKPAATSEAIKK